MRFIPTRVHGVLDYLVGALLIAAPWAFAFARGGTETWIPVALGVATILYSLMTDYELGVVRSLSMPTHLTLDIIAGIFLAASPWLFGFAEFVWIPHLMIGVIEILTGLTTERVPFRQRAARF